MIQIQHIYVPCLKVLKTAGTSLTDLWPPMAKVTIDTVKNVFQPKLTFFETYIKTKSFSVENNGQSDVVAF